MDGGIEYLKHVVVEDALGICAQLECDMQSLVDRYECEWAAVVRDPERRRAFRHFANSETADPAVEFVRERAQKRPRDWPEQAAPPALPAPETEGWFPVARAADVPADGGVTVQVGDAQVAVFHFASQGAWYACQAMCPHRGDMVLGRGLLGTQGGEPKVACPMHKKTFSLETGAGLADPQYAVQVFPVEVRDGEVYLKLPAADSLPRACGETASCPSHGIAAEVRP
jgi:nitrite reductase (NADH) large subunit